MLITTGHHFENIRVPSRFVVAEDGDVIGVAKQFRSGQLTSVPLTWFADRQLSEEVESGFRKVKSLAIESNGSCV